MLYHLNVILTINTDLYSSRITEPSNVKLIGYIDCARSQHSLFLVYHLRFRQDDQQPKPKDLTCVTASNYTQGNMNVSPYLDKKNAMQL